MSYGHLNKSLVKPNQVVKAGQPIGLGGSTGRSTGPHLHFETRYMGYAINPSAILTLPTKPCIQTRTRSLRTLIRRPAIFAPKRDLAKAEKNPYQSADNVASSYTGQVGRHCGFNCPFIRNVAHYAAQAQRHEGCWRKYGWGR